MKQLVRLGLKLLTEEVDVEVDGEQHHQDDVGEEVEVVHVFEEHVPAHAEETADQLVSKQLLAVVVHL